MSESKKKRTEKKSIKKAPGSKAINRDQTGRRTVFITASIIVSVVIAIILLIVGVSYYLSEDAKYRRLTIITVDDTLIGMDYFLMRAKLAGADPMSLLDTLTKELLIKLEAPRYGIEVTPEDINQALRIIASGGSENITDSELKEWYRQQLNETGLSDAEYKEIITTSLLAARLNEYLTERVPTIAEQVHLYAILLETYEDAEKIRVRWEAGEDFADLAREASVHQESRENGGDIGWWPRGITSQFDSAFDLTIDELSEPLPSEDGYYLLRVSEEADAREIDGNSLQILKSKALERWLPKEMEFHKINYNFNSVIYAWINLQLAKSKPRSSGQEQTQQ